MILEPSYLKYVSLVCSCWREKFWSEFNFNRSEILSEISQGMWSITCKLHLLWWYHMGKHYYNLKEWLETSVPSDVIPTWLFYWYANVGRCYHFLSGSTTDGEFCLLRSGGETRAIHLWQLIHHVRESVQGKSRTTLLKMLLVVDCKH